MGDEQKWAKEVCREPSREAAKECSPQPALSEAEGAQAVGKRPRKGSSPEGAKENSIAQSEPKPILEKNRGLQLGRANRGRFYPRRRFSADCASRFASTLNSRFTCEIENFNDRASFRQVQCSE